MRIINAVLLMFLFFSALYFYPSSVFSDTPVFALTNPTLDEPPLEILQFDTQKSLGSLIKVFIYWAFKFAGVFAFAMIVFAGFEYTTSGGNTSKQKDAQEKIIGAIVGIILLFSFYIILNTINPDILKEPSESASISETPTEETPAEEEEIQPQQIGNFVLIGTDATLDNYVSIPLSSELSKYNGVYIDKETADKLVILATKQDLGNWTVTEACTKISNGKCITTVDHESTCHSLGTCVDVGYGNDPGEIISKAFIDAANQAGFDVIDEYTNNTSLWCSSSGSGFHLEPSKSNCTNDGCWFCASA